MSSLLVATILFLPWIFMFIVQIKKVQHAFWAPEVSFNSIFSCFTIPFTEQFWTSNYSISLTVVMYSLIDVTLFMSFTKPFSQFRLALWLSVSVFLGTLFVATVISLISQPILSSRYVMAIVTMLVVPPTILIISLKIKISFSFNIFKSFY